MEAKDSDGNPPEVDGGIGEKTLEAINSLPPERMGELRDRYADELAKRYNDIVINHPEQKVHLQSWLGRTEFFRTFKLPK